MPSPGETFPQQFALSILQLKAQRDQQAAQLSEMRNQRASQNFLEQQRIDLAQQQANQNALQVGQQFQFQKERAAADIEVQKESQLARLALETKRIEKEREESVARSLSDFGRTGTAFIPSFAASKVPELLKSAPSDASSHYTTLDIPGHGTLIQKVDGDAAVKIREAEAKIAHFNAQTMLDQKRSELAAAQTAFKNKQVNNLIGKVDAQSARTAQNTIGDLRKLSNNIYTALIREDTPDARRRAAEIAADPSKAFADDSNEAQLWDSSTNLLLAFQKQALSGVAPPAAPSVDAMKNAGVDNVAFAGAPSAVAGAAPSTPSAPIVGSINDEYGNSFQIDTFGRRLFSGSSARDADYQALIDKAKRSPPGSRERATAEEALRSFSSKPTAAAPATAPSTASNPPAAVTQVNQSQFDDLKRQYQANPTPALKAQLLEIKARTPALR